jgi:hypothetical protein
MSVAAFAQIGSTTSVFGAVVAPATYLWLVGFHLGALSVPVAMSISGADAEALRYEMFEFPLPWRVDFSRES